MYSHLLVPIDCTDDSRQLAHALARFATPLIPCRITLVAAVTPTDDSELRTKRRRHASNALRALSEQLLGEGIWTQCRIVEGNDPALSVAAEGTNRQERYDLIVLGAHQTVPEDYDAPCKGSFADQLCRRTALPVLVLPRTYEGWG